MGEGLRARLSRRGLSALVATVMLISATIVGGLLVYNYFQRSMSTVAATSASLAVTARSDYLNNTARLVYIEAVNMHDSPVDITKVHVVLRNGTVVSYNLANSGSVVAKPNEAVEPGAKASILVVVPSDAAAVYLEYTVGGKTLQTQPARLG